MINFCPSWDGKPPSSQAPRPCRPLSLQAGSRRGKQAEPMRTRKPIGLAAMLAAVLLSACGGIFARPVDPKPGAVISGTIAMPGAKSASLSLRISGDGRMIEQGWITFSELKCPPSDAGRRACGSGMWSNVEISNFNCSEFSAGRISALIAVDKPVTNGKFEITSAFAGEISGQFTSPTAGKGKVHLAFFGGKLECGSWEWSTK
jgi:hypothetical protein